MKGNKKMNRVGCEAIVLLLALFLIVIVIHTHERNIKELKITINSIYVDRVVANDYIFDISRVVSSKKIALGNESDALSSFSLSNNTIDQLVVNFEKTKLTPEERILWNQLKKDIRFSVILEQKFSDQLDVRNDMHVFKGLHNQYDLILNDLEGLSAIQLTEGKRLLEASNQFIGYNGIVNRLGIASVIVVLLILLMRISSTRVLVQKKFSLN